MGLDLGVFGFEEGVTGETTDCSKAGSSSGSGSFCGTSSWMSFRISTGVIEIAGGVGGLSTKVLLFFSTVFSITMGLGSGIGSV